MSNYDDDDNQVQYDNQAQADNGDDQPPQEQPDQQPDQDDDAPKQRQGRTRRRPRSDSPQETSAKPAPKKTQEKPVSVDFPVDNGPIESYLISQEKHNANMKSTKTTDQTRWGKQIDPEKQNFEYGSYLKTDTAANSKSTKSTDTTRWGKAATLDPEKQNFEYGSYLKTSPSVSKPTTFSDSTRWGKAATIDPEKEKPLEYGSYLKQGKDSSSKSTNFSDKTRWGKAAETVFDEQQLTYGSYLDKQKVAQKEIAKEQQEKKSNAIKQLKEEVVGQFLDPEEHVFPYSELKDKFPKGVDATRKEYYLPDDEFEEIFGMTLFEFEKLGAFKKKQMKMKLGLY